ncbi:DUF6357 family protein [Microbacterium sp. MPKO10]|uniref:DUF6357 family protein n=1 Tax=Microbacterium sp. MPKO10 TaxID=2989818 RepID=UPI002235AF69|nr:DUF6357 family protein [Microbacterium sp. MPKO10]MCW4457992.1 DUF6357 family protein [Microbacterium sp. MPKO10]
MARRYGLAPKSFTFTDGEEHEREAAEQALLLLLSHGAVARIDGADDPKTEYCAVENVRRYWSFVMRFVEDGYAGLDYAGQWFADLADLAESPEERGERWAAAVLIEYEAIDEVCRIWADSGIVDPSNQYYVFFDTHALEVSRAERAE